MRARLLGHSGEVIETVLRHADGGMIPVELVARPVTFANQPRQAIAVRDVRARKKAEADLRHLAQHDSLTGLPNRRSFNSRLDREIAVAIGERQRLALLCLDLDRFKEVNDLFGHAAGDALLQSVARCTGSVLDDRSDAGAARRRRIRRHRARPARSGRGRTHRRKHHRRVPRRERRTRPMAACVSTQHRHRHLSQRRRSTAKA